MNLDTDLTRIGEAGDYVQMETRSAVARIETVAEAEERLGQQLLSVGGSHG